MAADADRGKRPDAAKNKRTKGKVMCKTIAIYNLKGGVGKTTLAWAAAAILTQRGYRILSIDLDSQCNLTYSLIGHSDPDNILRCMLDGTGLPVVTSDYGYLIPGSPMIDGLPDMADDRATRTRLLDKAVGRLKKTYDYDYILLDCPPGINLINVNALLAADYIVTPTHLDTYSLQGISRISDVIRQIREKDNPALVWAGIVVTDWRPRLLLTNYLATQARSAAAAYGTRLYDSAIKHSTRVNELILNRKPLTAAAGDPYIAYSCLVDNMLRSFGDKAERN